MSKKWWIVMGAVVAVVVIGAISVAVGGRMWVVNRYAARWSASGMAHRRVPYGLQTDPGDRVPFSRGMAPLQRMPCAHSFGPGRMWGRGRFGGPFALVAGLLPLAGLGVLICLAISNLRLRRELRAKVAAGATQAAGEAGPEA